MEQPSGGEENAKKEVVKAEAVTEAEKKSSGSDPDPSPKPDPDPKVNVADQRQVQQPPQQQQQDDVIKIENSNDNESSDVGKAAAIKSKKSVRWSEELVMESPSPRTAAAQSSSDDRGSNPYVAYSSSPSNDSSSFDFKGKMDTVKNVLGRWGKKVGEATRKAEDFAGNTWQHLKTGPSLADAALGRIAQGTKVLAEGGYEKIFRQTFDTVPEELLQDSFACYLSTSAGPVMGILYVSTAKLAFCSDNPLSYKAGDKTEWSYYKVVIPLHQLKAVNPSASRTNSAEKYIQVISIDNHEFWFMGFLNYSGAVTRLEDVLQARDLQSV